MELEYPNTNASERSVSIKAYRVIYSYFAEGLFYSRRKTQTTTTP